MEVTELNYPIEKEQAERETEGTATFERDPRRFTFRPYKNKEKATNKLFFSSFHFNRFSWFTNWPDLVWYFLKLPIHRVQVVAANGKLMRGMVICEASMNKYATETLSQSDCQVPAPFPGAKTCPFCIHANKLWTQYKDEKKKVGLEGLTTERFKEEIRRHPHISKIREMARAWGAQDTYYFLVFDYDKYLGTVQPEEGDGDSLGFQACFGPAKVRDGLYDAQVAKCKFWDFRGGGFRVVNVKRDNTQGARFCKYSVQPEFEPAKVDGTTLAYLQDPPAEDMHDPREWIEQWSNEDKTGYIKAYGTGSPIPSDDESVPQEPEENGQGPDKDSAPPTQPGRGAARPPLRRPTSPPQQPAPPKDEAPSQEPLWDIDGAKAANPNAAAEQPAPPSTPEPPSPTPQDAGPRRSRVSWRK